MGNYIRVEELEKPVKYIVKEYDSGKFIAEFKAEEIWKRHNIIGVENRKYNILAPKVARVYSIIRNELMEKMGESSNDVLTINNVKVSDFALTRDVLVSLEFMIRKYGVRNDIGFPGHWTYTEKLEDMEPTRKKLLDGYNKQQRKCNEHARIAADNEVEKTDVTRIKEKRTLEIGL